MFQTFSFRHVEYLAQAGLWTLTLSALALVGGSVLGTGVALARISPVRAIRAVSQVYLFVVQGTPLLVLLFIAYFGVAYAGLDVPPLAAASVAFALYAGAFLGDIWRGAIQAVPPGQWESAAALGLTRWRTLRLVVVPQAIRIAVPPTLGFAVQLVKNTALASVIGFVELTRAGQIVANSTFQPLKVFLTVGAMYFVICFTLSLVARQLETRVPRLGPIAIQ
jgi:polar amino acid transport system permease protein